MTMLRRGLHLALGAFLAWASPCLRADEGGDPAAKWLGAYAWIQTAERLAESDQWPLALGSYLEANRRIAELAAAHPDFEPEMVAYRREALATTIASTEERLTDDEHETMMKYLDFVESLESGEAQRYANRFEEARGTLGMAKALLEEIVEKKPETFRSAVAWQLDRLESSLAWLDSQLNWSRRPPRRAAASFDSSIDWGTTRFVKAEDLPKAAEGGAVAGALFPGGPLDAAEPSDETEKEESAAASTGPRRFRMSSRQASDGAAEPGKKAEPDTGAP